MKMNKTMISFIGCILLSASSAFAQEVPVPPPQAKYFISGAIVDGFGVINLAVGYSACAIAFDSKAEQSCFLVQTATGFATIVVGTTLMLVWNNQRLNYNDWKVAHPALAGISPFGYSVNF